MINEARIINNVSAFKDFLSTNGYSKHVIPMYTRKVKAFLNVCSLPNMDHEELKSYVSEYLETIPLTSQRAMIQAALHSYYDFISGNRYLRRLNAKDFVVNRSIEAEIEEFRKYLYEVAGLNSNTITSQCNTVRTFLYSSFSGKDFSPAELTADHVRIYLSQTLQHVSASSKKTMIGRIRSYVRFLQFRDGFQSEEVMKLPMTTPVWKRAGLAKYLTATELDRLFSTYDQTSPTGIRNYAIARCLKDLGLRCSEVAGLTLDDFNWVQGSVSIKNTKTHSERTLPLHKTTGKALEAYLLHSRPITQERILFVRFKNELGRPMGTSQVRRTVRYAAMKAGLENFTGTHMLRHTAAKEMINNDVDLKTIADILGHESIETTSIYTKINFTELQTVAGIWPEVRL